MPLNFVNTRSQRPGAVGIHPSAIQHESALRAEYVELAATINNLVKMSPGLSFLEKKHEDSFRKALAKCESGIDSLQSGITKKLEENPRSQFLRNLQVDCKMLSCSHAISLGNIEIGKMSARNPESREVWSNLCATVPLLKQEFQTKIFNKPTFFSSLMDAATNWVSSMYPDHEENEDDDLKQALKNLNDLASIFVTHCGEKRKMVEVCEKCFPDIFDNNNTVNIDKIKKRIHEDIVSFLIHKLRHVEAQKAIIDLTVPDDFFAKKKSFSEAGKLRYAEDIYNFILYTSNKSFQIRDEFFSSFFSSQSLQPENALRKLRSIHKEYDKLEDQYELILSMLDRLDENNQHKEELSALQNAIGDMKWGIEKYINHYQSLLPKKAPPPPSAAENRLRVRWKDEDSSLASSSSRSPRTTEGSALQRKAKKRPQQQFKQSTTVESPQDHFEESDEDAEEIELQTPYFGIPKVRGEQESWMEQLERHKVQLASLKKDLEHSVGEWNDILNGLRSENPPPPQELVSRDAQDRLVEKVRTEIRMLNQHELYADLVMERLDKLAGQTGDEAEKRKIEAQKNEYRDAHENLQMTVYENQFPNPASLKFLKERKLLRLNVTAKGLPYQTDDGKYKDRYDVIKVHRLAPDGQAVYLCEIHAHYEIEGDGNSVLNRSKKKKYAQGLLGGIMAGRGGIHNNSSVRFI